MHVCDFRQITTDAEYCALLDELEQLLDAPDSIPDARLAQLSAMIRDYESRVAGTLGNAMATLAAQL
jgi:hypothetical protein